MKYPFAFDPQCAPWPSRRTPLCARRGMVATTSAQAAQAGLAVLRKGGNAVDAAVAAAATLTVTEPTSNGIGSDSFALVWMDGALYGLNASGLTPASLTVDKVREKHGGVTAMPRHGWTPVMVPGAPAGWAELSRRFGELPFKDLFEDAIGYAREGYALTPTVAQLWKDSLALYSAECTSPEFDEWYRVFAPEGRAPEAGEIVVLPDHADTLAAIAESGARDFYEGDLAKRIADESKTFGGFLELRDLAEYAPLWVDPVSMSYRGYELWEIPPNGQGLAALITLNILKEFPLSRSMDDRNLHLQWEAMKRAFVDTMRYVTDPACMQDGWRTFLDPAFGERRAAEITDRASEPVVTDLPGSGTVYLCTADRHGNMVSFIQSNYQGFGSGIVVGGTGISLQNRGADFTLDHSSANILAPRKRSYHTIIPAFITRNGEPVGPMGVMGGYMQPQGHVQMMTNLADYRLNPQQALDAPRWQWTRGNRFLVEPGFPPHLVKQLAARGHTVSFAAHERDFGRGQMILRLENGVYMGATEPRADGSLACW